jgi:putative Mn2+ efflux pump MntP
MDFFLVMLIAIGLAMDCFAVSIAAGTSITSSKQKLALIMALFFGLFQSGMLILGWVAGISFYELISGFDHWIAFLILALIGGKMILEGMKEEKEKSPGQYARIPVLLVLSVATSIDSLGVGLSFALLNTGILISAAVIGAVSFIFSYAGVSFGSRLGGILGNKVEVIGGVILIIIGVQILFEHLGFI